MKSGTCRSLSVFLARMITIPLLTLWILSLFLITWATARDFYLQLEASSLDVVRAADYSRSTPDGLPGWETHQMLSNLSIPNILLGAESLLPITLPQAPSSISTDNPFWGNWELLYGYRAAMAYQTPQGDPILQTGNYLFFLYSHTRTGEPAGYGYIDLARLDRREILTETYISSHPMGDMFPFLGQTLQMTGYFEESRFHPVQLAILWPSGAQTIYSAETERETVTIFAQPRGYHVQPSPIFAKGNRYETVTELLHDNVHATGFRCFNAVIRTTYAMEHQGYLTLVVHCSPLLYAMLRLLPAYLISAVCLCLCRHLLLARIRKILTEPLTLINHGYEANRTQLSAYADTPVHELQQLKANFETAQQLRHTAENEVQQLQTTLHYARNAEENRKKMVSAMAHELKTPLSVIHSYAEGLQEDIAADKRQTYLSIIQDEAKHMDAIVLEMLDLSRLEAGRVRLHMDQFSLSGLAKEVWDTLSLSAEEKQLELRFSAPEECIVTADRTRIRQVMVNLISNAIQYTSPGGRIAIRISRLGGNARFSIENKAAPLSEEALSRLFESFYRADDAHSGRGTGLGLAISKAIITLHRGSCDVRNTGTGVEFRFEIPC